MHLPDTRVVVAGDWDGDRRWATKAFRALREAAPDVETILHVGDFYPGARPLEGSSHWLDHIDELAWSHGIRRILVTLGNHEPWPTLAPLIAGGKPAQVSVAVWVLPRPYRFTIAGREVLSLGGAASLDRERRVEGVTWFPEEAITEDHVEQAIAGGPADLMLTHESPEPSPVRAVAHLLRRRSRFSTAVLAASQASRERVTRVWGAVRPELLIHGHMHEAGGGQAPDGRRVVSLGGEGQWGNMLVLEALTLSGDAVVTPIPHAYGGSLPAR